MSATTSTSCVSILGFKILLSIAFLLFAATGIIVPIVLVTRSKNDPSSNSAMKGNHVFFRMLKKCNQ